MAVCRHDIEPPVQIQVDERHPEGEFQQIVGDYHQFILAGGHTHLQQIRRWGETLFFNPGSVGFVRDLQWQGAGFRLYPWADYAILSVDGSGLGLEFRRVPVEIAELLLTIRVSGRPNAEILAGRYEQAEQSQAISQTYRETT